jgi:sugar-specific transcriptional regulator TrmB
MEIKIHIQNLLKKIGLSETEARLYLAALEKPKSTLKDLEKNTGASTATVYRAFDKLREMGLITSSQDNWRKNVEAIPLKSIGEKLASEQRKLRKVEMELRTLNNLFDLSSGSFAEDPVEVITEENQMYDKYFQILNKPWGNLLAYGSAERLIDVYGSDAEHQFVDIRCRKGKTANIILTQKNEYAEEILEDNNEKRMRRIRIKEDPNNQNYMSYIYGDEMAIFHDGENGKRAVIVKDPLLVKISVNNFWNTWNTAA